MQFKLFITLGFVLCICFVQKCQSVDDQTMKEYMEYFRIPDLNMHLNGSTAIKDINPEFVEDVRMILAKFDNNTFVTMYILVLMNVLANTYHGKDSKITSAVVKERNLVLRRDECHMINTIDILQSMTLERLPSERVNGVLNLLYVLGGDGTEENAENALGYLYGTEARPMTANPNITSMASLNCSMYSNAMAVAEIGSLNSTKLNRKVLEDVQIISEKFPYAYETLSLLEIMKKLLIELDGKNSTNEICKLKDQNYWFEISYTEQHIAFKLIDLEIILSTRVPEENFMDMLNLIRASYKLEGSDWKKALEYAYTPDYFKADWCK